MIPLPLVFALVTEAPAGASAASNSGPATSEEAPLVADVVRASLEPSYVAYAVGFGLEPLIFEANIAPHFSVLPKPWRVGLWLTPKVVVRMFAEQSTPVRTPSYMPRLTFAAWLQQRVDGPIFYASAIVSHHSNGQSGPFLNADGSVNHKDGDFSTNFLELSLTRVAHSSALFGWATLALEWHPGFNQNDELEGRYGFWRIHLATTVARQLFFEDKLTLQLSAILDEFQRSTSNLSVGEAERFPVHVRYTVRIPTVDLGLFAGAYWGHDYYNIWFDRMIGAGLFGIAGDLSSTPGGD